MDDYQCKTGLEWHQEPTHSYCRWPCWALRLVVDPALKHAQCLWYASWQMADRQLRSPDTEKWPISQINLRLSKRSTRKQYLEAEISITVMKENNDQSCSNLMLHIRYRHFTRKSHIQWAMLLALLLVRVWLRFEERSDYWYFLLCPPDEFDYPK